MSPRKAPPQPKVFAEAYAEHRAVPVSPAGDYVVAGRHAVFGYLPGETLTLPQHVAKSLVESGNLIPAQKLPAEPEAVEDPGHLPEVNESEQGNG